MLLVDTAHRKHPFPFSLSIDPRRRVRRPGMMLAYMIVCAREPSIMGDSPEGSKWLAPKSAGLLPTHVGRSVAG